MCRVDKHDIAVWWKPVGSTVKKVDTDSLDQCEAVDGRSGYVDTTNTYDEKSTTRICHAHSIPTRHVTDLMVLFVTLVYRCLPILITKSP